MPKCDGIDDRMKFYEKNWGNSKYLMPLVPGIIRLDGKNFSSFTKGLNRPFDMNLIDLMIETTKFLVEETNAVIGYTQSDKITLILMSDNFNSQIYFDGKINKINSILASKCSVFFNKNLSKFLPDKVDKDPVFDCRCFSVPNETEAINVLVWREQDATRNSVQMAGQSEFSHKQLHNKSCDNIQDMLFKERKINWNDYPSKCKRGTYVKRQKIFNKLTPDELNKLPEKHEARRNPELVIERSEIKILTLPVITKVTNVKDVVFRGHYPSEGVIYDVK